MPGDLTAAEFAAKVGVSVPRVKQWAQAGRIVGAYKHGNRWFFPAKAKRPEKLR